MRKKFIFVPLEKKILTTYIGNSNYISFNFDHDKLLVQGVDKKINLIWVYMLLECKYIELYCYG